MNYWEDVIEEAEQIAARAFEKASPVDTNPEDEILALAKAYEELSRLLIRTSEILREHGIPGSYEIGLVRAWVVFFSAAAVGQPWAVELRRRIQAREFGTTDQDILPRVLEEVLKQPFA